MGVQINGSEGNVIATKGTFSGDVGIGGTLTYEDVTNIDSVGIITARSNILVGSGITLSPDGDIFFTGIMTGNGSGLTGVANTDVIFPDKISLGDGTATSGDQINVGLGSDLKFYHDGSNSYIQHGGTGNLITRITKDDGIFRIYGNGDTFIANFVDNGAVQLYHNGPKQCETSTNGLAFPSGKGLDFSATSGTGTSELLDDYEEGNFTPTVNSIASPNYTVAAGRYTKIGNLVTAQVYLLMASGGGEGSVFSIGSLPFTSTNTTYKEGGGSIIYENGFFDNSSTVSPKNTCTVWVPANNTIIQFHKRYNGAAIWGNDTSFGTGANNVYLIVQVCYVAA